MPILRQPAMRVAVVIPSVHVGVLVFVPLRAAGRAVCHREAPGTLHQLQTLSSGRACGVILGVLLGSGSRTAIGVLALVGMSHWLPSQAGTHQ